MNPAAIDQRESMFHKAVPGMLLVSLLSVMAGCTSTKSITDLSHYRGEEIEVFTKGGPNYRLTEWTANFSRDITGRGAVYYRDRHFEPYSGTIPAESIAAIKGEKLVAVRTGLVVGGAAILIFGAPKISDFWSDVVEEIPD